MKQVAENIFGSVSQACVGCREKVVAGADADALQCAHGDDALLARRELAREAKKLNDGLVLERHRKVVGLLVGGQGEWVRQKAIEQIDKWEHNNLCNPRYIKAWRELIQLPAAAMALAMLSDDAESVALRQNSPFSHAMALVEGVD